MKAGQKVWARDTYHNAYQDYGLGLYVREDQQKIDSQGRVGHWVEYFFHDDTQTPSGVMGLFFDVKEALLSTDKVLERTYL